VRNGRLEVLLIHRPRYDDWSWPKGKLETGEHLVECALREAEEETGYQVVLGPRLQPVEYRLRSGRMKQVHYWSARLAGPDDSPVVAARPPVQQAAGEEVDDMRWLSALRARRMLTRRKDRRPLDELMMRRRAQTLDCAAVVVLRHAEAVKRADWDGAEATRPLTAVGKAAAKVLPGLLAAFGLTVLQTSPWRRCRQTLGPYARLCGLPRQNMPSLTETVGLAQPFKTAAVVTMAVQTAAAGQATVICSHRPALPALLGALDLVTQDSATVWGRNDCRWQTVLRQAELSLHTAEMLVAWVSRRGKTRGTVVSLETYRP
jgi:8-oxo-dGTP diphosphatase